ncbi:Tn7 transposase TnsA N-terminal domain-containing protein [Sutcliffiella horikoshii]|uniref:Tn7 transposase TnsA N-terminal domain-containing protein n=2 Tax=Sutcliffiella TaxID=2837511 RepID=UPI00384AD4E5
MRSSRKIKASNKMSTRGKHHSSKMFKMIPWESTLERDFIKLLDFDQTIEFFHFQPLQIDFLYQGKRRKYFPDFLVQRKNGKSYIYEVKAFSKVNEPENILKFQVGYRYCSENDMTYKIVTEKDIRKGYLIENLDILNEVRVDSTSKRIMNEIMNTIETCGNRISIIELQEKLKDIEEAILECNLFYLLNTQILYTDLETVPITSNSILEMK